MARLWPGAGSTVDYLSIPASSIWAVNTNLCVMAIVFPDFFVNGNVIASMGDSGDSRGFGLDLSGTAGIFEQNNAGIGGVPGTTTTAMTVSEWNAVMCAWSTGGNRAFKRYRYSTSNLATETVTSSTVTNAPQAADAAGKVGQWLILANVSCWRGHIDRVLIGQGTAPSDAEFTAWARAGTIPPSLTVKGYWILSPQGTSVSPEVDLSVNGNNLTVTGTTASAAFVLPDAGLTMNVSDSLGIGDQRFVPA